MSTLLELQARVENGQSSTADQVADALEQHYILTSHLVKLRLITCMMAEIAAMLDEDSVPPEAEFRAVLAKVANWEIDVYLAMTGDEDDRVKADDDR